MVMTELAKLACLRGHAGGAVERTWLMYSLLCVTEQGLANCAKSDPLLVSIKTVLLGHICLRVVCGCFCATTTVKLLA